MLVAVIFHHLGPYHVARLTSLSSMSNILVIELSGITNDYSWDRVNVENKFKHITLFPDKNAFYINSVTIRKNVGNILNEYKPDIIAINGYSEKGALLALDWCLNHNVPSILMSASNKYDSPRYYFKELLKRQIIRLFDAALVGGQRQKEYLVSLGFSPEKIFHGYNVVDNSYFKEEVNRLKDSVNEIKNKYGIKRDFFLTSARFLPRKNLINLLKAYHIYKKKSEINHFDLVILGDGPEKPRIENMIKKLGLTENVHLPGFLQYDKLPEFYAAAKIFILPSLREQWGLVVNEAMASGLPVLVSNMAGCAPDLVEEGINGFSFNPKKPEELSGLMLKLINDNKLRERMGNESKRIIKKLSPDTFAFNLRLVAETALASSSSKYKGFARMILKFALIR